jgi:putative component of membrane protein insertase Oxa1/YidC/SpoIIIJ protein YidD
MKLRRAPELQRWGSFTRLATAGSIEAYQRVLASVKGFCCAHRFVHGGASCSEYVRRAVLRFGPVKAFALAGRRFGRCREAYALLSSAIGVGFNWFSQQAPTRDAFHPL